MTRAKPVIAARKRKKESAPAQRERTQANGYPYTVYQPGRAASRTKEVRPWQKS